MKEKVLSDKRIIKILKKEHYLKIETICRNCLHNVLELVLDNFDENDVNFTITPINPELYSVIITLWDKSEDL